VIRALLGVAGVALGAFLMLELTARVYLFGLAGLDPRKVQSLRDFRETDFVRPSDDARLGFEHAPDAKGFFKLVPYETNSVGMRDREYAVRKPENTFRVLVMGSSFMVPAGVRIEDAFHSVMEERLSADRAPVRYEFLNFAIGAFHPRQVLALLNQRALAYDPDLILFGTTSLSMPLMTADASRAPGPGASVRARTHPFWSSFLLKLLEVRTGRISAEIPHQLPVPGEGKSVITMLGRLSRRADVPIVVIRLEFDANRAGAGEMEVVREVRAAGLYFFDTREHFADVEPTQLWIHELDPHPNEEAHLMFADAVTTYLDASNLLGPKAN
jgi:hypothetical protein